MGINYRLLIAKTAPSCVLRRAVRKNKGKVIVMNDTRVLLEFVYKNAEMGRKTIQPLSEMTDDEKFSKELVRIGNDYAEICADADKLLRENGMDEASGLNIAEKMMTEVSLRMNTIKDRSVRHIADMLIKGGSMGMSDISKKIEELTNADDKSRSLAKRLLDLNSSVIDDMKKYLTVAQ